MNKIWCFLKSTMQLGIFFFGFEYLLYEHHLRRAAAEELSRRKTAEEAALGSLSSGSSRSAVDAEFLKGVWGR